MKNNIARKMQQTYNIAYWGGGYYQVNEQGNISVCPNLDQPEAKIDLAALVEQVQEEQQHLRLPALFVFRKFYNIDCDQLMLHLNGRVVITVIKVITFLSTQLK